MSSQMQYLLIGACILGFAAMPEADPAKWVAPKELADVILFLASDAASAVTGALLPVNGRV